MKHRRTVDFKREFKFLPPKIRRVASTKFSLFRNNWRHPSLNVHKLEGRTWHSHQVFDLYVTDKYRVLFVIDHDVIVSFSIGTHGIVSK
jgi:hypothetical protein